MSLPDLVGLCGVAAYVGAYALLQTDRLHSSDGRYLLLNGLGSVLIIVSLFDSFNLPSLVTQVLWLAFTIVGYARTRRHRDAAEGIEAGRSAAADRPAHAADAHRRAVPMPGDPVPPSVPER